MHEAVHGVFHPITWVNSLAGRWTSAFFPTSFGLQKGFHLTHHKNNRTVIERFDYIQPGDVKWLKYAQWYSILTGFYWVVSVIGVLSYLVIPQALRSRTLRGKNSQFAKQTSSQAYLEVFDKLPAITTQLEILFSLSVQASLFLLLDLNLLGWAVCYAAFALNWSSLQYADHAFSPLDVRNGAWNLRINPLIKAFFLNYHYHLAHHQHPNIPWLYLRQFVDKNKPQPAFISIWFQMWRGPQQLPAEAKVE